MEGTPKAIEPKGIVRNATKIGVQDGQAEDLINLRFMDGSWRASGNGRHVYSMSQNEGGYTYEQLYVHTNSYHHLIGYRDGGIYWFANIDNDGVFEPIAPRLVCDEVDDTEIIYAQTGHLLTIIKNRERITIFFNKATGEYELQERMTGDNSYSHPIGNVQYKVANRMKDGEPMMIYTRTQAKCIPTQSGYVGDKYNASKEYVKAAYTGIQHYLEQENSYYGAFLVCLAVKLYSGKWGWATAPTLVYPSYIGDTLLKDKNCGGRQIREWEQDGQSYRTIYNFQDTINSPVYIITKEMMKDGENDPIEIGENYYKSRYHLDGTRRDGQSILFDPQSVIVADATGSSSGVSGEYTCATGLSTYDKLPTMGDCYLRADDDFADPKVYSEDLSFREHLVWGKLNDLYINIENLNIQKNAIYKKIGVFITPILGGNGNPLDFNELSFNDIIGDIFWKSSIYQKFPVTFTTKYNAGEVTYTGGQSVLSLTTDHGAFSCWRPDHRFSSKHLENCKKALANSQFFLIKEIDIDDIEEKTWMKVELEEGTLSNLTTYATNMLPTDAFTAMAFVNAQYGYMYNGRLHLANYRKSAESIWGMKHILNNDYSDGGIIKTEERNYTPLINLTSIYADEEGTRQKFNDEISLFNQAYRAMFSLNNFENMTVTMDALPVPMYEGRYDLDVMESVRRYISPFIPYANMENNQIDLFFNMRVRDWVRDIVEESHYKLELPLENEMTYYSIRFYFNIMDNGYDFQNNKYEGLADPQKQDSRVDIGFIDVPNGLIVSAVDTPMYFPAENSYQVGNSEIVAMASNAIAVGTGQTGESPLYVFTKDGIYGLFVDDTGNMAYKNSRILARDILNNMSSVCQIDAGVVFTTDRGLMMIAGEQVQEIGAPAEGDVVQFWNAESVDCSKIVTAAMQQIAGLPSNLCSTTDFLTYLKDKGTLNKAAIVNYNHNLRELIVSNPNYPYSYVLDREGNWSRRDYTAAQYVINFPTSYRLTNNGEFYKLDEEGDETTSLEHRKEADNKIFYLSNVIKLDSIGFKQAYRFVVRGYFETVFANREMITDTIDNRKIIVMGLSIDNLGIGEVLRIAYLHIYGMDAWVSVGEHGEVGNILALEIYDALTLENITKTFRPTGMPGEYITLIKTETTERPAIACVVEGSYDGRKFKPLGYNRKSGKFRDIGCLVSHTDMRFFRICLSGQVTGKTRIDYMEMSAGASLLNTKIR